MALSRSQILEIAAEARGLHDSIGRTFRERSTSKDGYIKWTKATQDWHSYQNPLDHFWSDEFLVALREGQRDAMEDAITYLEADPWYYRSGYLKEKLIKKLKAEHLSERDRTRLRAVVWNVARGRNRREFRNYCNLALRVTSKEFERLLSEVSPEQNEASRGKLFVLLHHLQAGSSGTSYKGSTQI